MVKLSDIIKTQDIIRVSPEENLSSALSKLTTSHDAAFCFADKEFKGLVNPYYDLIKSSYPGNAKVEHCLYHPPKIKKNFPISKVVELLIESKVHYLPVFDDGGFVGIISARRILSRNQNSEVFRSTISEVLKDKKRELVTVREEDLVSKAVSLFKDTKKSKLIVVDRKFKLKGILSHYDIISYLVAPKSSPSRGSRVSHGRNSFHQLTVKNFAKTYVLTLTREHTLSDALHLILTKKIGSVVVIDKERHPVGIITTRDLLRFLVRREQEKQVQLISRNLSTQSRQIVGGFFNYFLSHMKKLPSLTRAKIFVEEEKQGKLYKVALSLFPKKGTPKVIREEGRDLQKLLSNIKKK